MKIYLDIIQPTVPEYRLPLFSALSSRDDINLLVHASPTMMNSPKSIDGEYDWLDLSCEIIQIIPNRILWQKGLRIRNEKSCQRVLVISGNPRFLSNYVLWVKAKSIGIPVIWWGHGWSASSNWLTSKIRKLLMKFADVVMLYTEKEAENYIKSGFSSRRTIGINNSIDQSNTIKAIAYWGNDRLKKFKIENNINNKNVLLFCGRLTNKTRLDILIKALKYLAKDNILLVIIGNGPKKDLYKKLAIENNVDKKVIWIDETYDEMKLAPWFLSAKCSVYPGSIGLSLLHAFGYSLPVITHDKRSKQMPEIAALIHGYNGLEYKYNEPQDLIKTIKSLIHSDKILNKMRENAQFTVKSKYSLENMVNNFYTAVQLALLQAQKMDKQ